MLHDYQRRRVLTFLEPEGDPLGAGYHILQSKIALGSGGLFGRGLLQGTQSHLNFLPEKQTDFIFTMLAEEFGLVGSLAMLAIYIVILAHCFAVALSAKSQFGRLVAIGVTTTFFLYLFINMAMVMGLLPVVGVPLPLVSYGGTAIVSLMLGFGLVMCVHVHRDVRSVATPPARNADRTRAGRRERVEKGASRRSGGRRLDNPRARCYISRTPGA